MQQQMRSVRVRMARRVALRPHVYLFAFGYSYELCTITKGVLPALEPNISLELVIASSDQADTAQDPYPYRFTS